MVILYIMETLSINFTWAFPNWKLHSTVDEKVFFVKVCFTILLLLDYVEQPPYRFDKVIKQVHSFKFLFEFVLSSYSPWFIYRHWRIFFQIGLFDEIKIQDVNEEKLCPRFPEPVFLKHPIPVLMDALEKVGPAMKIKS